MASRTAISEAVGILMEREAITADRAFELLRKASQETQVKLRDIAREVLERHEERLGGANIRSL